jgi:hypothetical protein
VADIGTKPKNSFLDSFLEGNRLTSAADVIIIVHYVVLTVPLTLKYGFDIVGNAEAKFLSRVIGESIWILKKIKASVVTAGTGKVREKKVRKAVPR